MSCVQILASARITCKKSKQCILSAFEIVDLVLIEIKCSSLTRVQMRSKYLLNESGRTLYKTIVFLVCIKKDFIVDQ